MQYSVAVAASCLFAFCCSSKRMRCSLEVRFFLPFPSLRFWAACEKSPVSVDGPSSMGSSISLVFKCSARLHPRLESWLSRLGLLYGIQRKLLAVTSLILTSSITSNDAFMHRIVRRHPLTDSKFFNRFTCRNDLMHCMDHHGVYGDIFASAAVCLIYNDGRPRLGATQPARLDAINHRLRVFYGENPGITSRLNQLKKKSLLPAGTADYAALGGPTVKAASTRQTMPMLKELADRHLTDIDNLDHVIMHQLINHTREFRRRYIKCYLCRNPSNADCHVCDEPVCKGHSGRCRNCSQIFCSNCDCECWEFDPTYSHSKSDHDQNGGPPQIEGRLHWENCSNVGKLENGPYKEAIQLGTLLEYFVWLAIELDI